MTLKEMKRLFRNEDDFLDFDSVRQHRTQRSDLYAFLLLDELMPGGSDMIAGAEHDEIFLGVDMEKLAKVITEQQVLDLVRCGVRYDEETDGLAMFA